MLRKNKMLTEAEISSFCQQIHMIVKAGFPIYYGISILRDDATDEGTKELLTQIYEPMEAGVCLYDALSATGVFPAYMLEMIHVGEQTGRLEDVLYSLRVYYEREAEIRDGIKQVVTYPLIMSTIMLAIIVVIITKVVPIFSDVYAELGSALTGSAKMLMNVSNFLNQYLFLILLIVLALGVIAFLLVKSPIGKKFFEGKGIFLALASSRFANCMYLALSSGLDTDQGFALAENLVENNFMKKRIQQCRALISEGESFHKAILASGIFSNMYSNLISIGYKTSAMDDVMFNISKAYESETDSKIHHLISILEPTLIIILSFFIGLILISFLLPLLGIMSSIG